MGPSQEQLRLTGRLAPRAESSQPPMLPLLPPRPPPPPPLKPRPALLPLPLLLLLFLLLLPLTALGSRLLPFMPSPRVMERRMRRREGLSQLGGG